MLEKQLYKIKALTLFNGFSDIGTSAIGKF